MKKLAVILGMTLLLAIGFSGAALATHESVTELHTWTAIFGGKGSKTQTVVGTITDEDPVPHPVTVTNTVTETTTVTVTTGTTTTTPTTTTTTTTEPPPPPPPLNGDPMKGVSTGGGINWYDQAGMAADLQLVKELDAQYVRLDARWDWAEPTDNQYDWTKLDQLYNEATARGLRVQWIVTWTPAWARGFSGDIKTYPTNASDFGDFAQALATRYDADYEIWNEPNANWAAADVTDTGAAKLGAMIRDASVKIKSVDDDALVISGGIVRGGAAGSTSYRLDTEYLNALYPHIDNYVDGVGFHPYSYPHNPSDTTVNRLFNGWNGVDDMAALVDVPIWITEWGQHTGSASESVSESEQATYVQAAWNRYLAAVQAGDVDGSFFVYNHRDGGTDLTNKEQNFGLARFDESHKPAWNVFVSLDATQPPPPPPTGVTLQPGQSWDAAYEAAPFGSTINLAGGNHGSQTIQSTRGNRDGFNPHITFQPLPGATVILDKLSLYAPHITVKDVRSDGLSIDGYENRNGGDILLEDYDLDSGDLSSAQNITFRRVDFGPNYEGTSSNYPWPQDAFIINAWPPDDGNHPKNVLIEDSIFHDVTKPTSTAHSDCLQFTAGENITIRGTSFHRCAHADIQLAPDQGPVLDFLFEDNWFDRTTLAFYSINASHKGELADEWNNVVIRGNTEMQNTRLDSPGMRFENNKSDSMSSNKCSTAKGVGVDIQNNVYKSGIVCGTGDRVDPDLDLSYESWLNR